MIPDGRKWPEVAAGMRTLKLSAAVRLLAPSLLVSSLPRNAVGFSFERGRVGLLTGAFVLTSSLVLGGLLYEVAGWAGLLLPIWLMGSTGALMVATSLRPLAFVKPLCSGCRLLPIIEEHEAMHLRGVHSEEKVWEEARKKVKARDWEKAMRKAM